MSLDDLPIDRKIRSPVFNPDFSAGVFGKTWATLTPRVFTGRFNAEESSLVSTCVEIPNQGFRLEQVDFLLLQVRFLLRLEARIDFFQN